MLRQKLFALGIASVVAVACGVGFVVADSAKDNAAPAGAAPPLPPGWTEADMQACIVAGTPGEMHKLLTRHVGEWDADITFWPYPGAEPIKSTGTSKTTPLFDGRYIQTDMNGEMPGMGAHTMKGFVGYDNVAQKFVASWVDNMGTGIMHGTGELSPDQKTVVWSYDYHCPITKKIAHMRDVETFTSDTTKTLEVHNTDPKSGKEFLTVKIEFKKKA